MVAKKPVRLNESLGAALRERREARSLSIESVSKSLNIPATQLASLEEGNFFVFAAEVYARGVYLKYAQFLGFDQKSAQGEVLRALAAVRQLSPLTLHTPFSWFERLVLSRVILAGCIAAVGLVVGGYIVWQIQSYFHLPLLAVTAPITDIATQSDITIMGKSEPETRVNLNGEPVLLHKDATFAVPINLHPGINIIRIEAQNASGRKRIVERTILLPRRQL